MKTKKTLSIVGFGQFGKFLSGILKPYFNVLVSSKSDHTKDARRLGLKFVSLKEAAEANIILLTMPISATEEVIKKISPFVKPGALVIDTCSIKVNPAKYMKKYLPKNVEILATHPLFGPQSGKHGIRGLKIIVWPVRLIKKKCAEIKNFLKNDLGLEVIEMAPEEHDKTVALWQALTHFVAKGIARTNLKESKILTPSAQKILSAVSDVKHDSESLFCDMQKLNPYAKAMREKLIKNLSDINKKIK